MSLKFKNMKFEEFEEKIRAKGFGIVAMNHYTLKGVWRTYCVVLGEGGKEAIKAEAEKSEDVFDEIYRKICE